MAEKKKKKKQQIKGMPTTSIQSRMPSKTNRGKAGKVAKPKKKYGTGVVGQLAKRRAERKAAGKWTLGEKLTKAGRKRASARRGESVQKKRRKKLSKKAYLGGAEEQTTKQTGKLRRGARAALVTKGGIYAKYKPKSKAAKSFRSTFKSKCAGGAKSFSWDGRSYSCKKK